MYVQGTPGKKEKQTPAKKGAPDPTPPLESPGIGYVRVEIFDERTVYELCVLCDCELCLLNGWCSSIAECRGEREEGATDQGLEGAEDSCPEPRSVSHNSTYISRSMSSLLCGVWCSESSVKQRLMLIKTKAVDLVAYLKVQHSTVYTAYMHTLTHDCMCVPLVHMTAVHCCQDE